MTDTTITPNFLTNDNTPRILTVDEADEILREHFPHIEDLVEDSGIIGGMHSYYLSDGRTIEIEWGKQRLIDEDGTGFEWTMQGFFAIDATKPNYARRMVCKY